MVAKAVRPSQPQGLLGRMAAIVKSGGQAVVVGIALLAVTAYSQNVVYHPQYVTAVPATREIWR